MSVLLGLCFARLQKSTLPFLVRVLGLRGGRASPERCCGAAPAAVAVPEPSGCGAPLAVPVAVAGPG